MVSCCRSGVLEDSGYVNAVECGPLNTINGEEDKQFSERSGKYHSKRSILFVIRQGTTKDDTFCNLIASSFITFCHNRDFLVIRVHLPEEDVL